MPAQKRSAVSGRNSRQQRRRAAEVDEEYEEEEYFVDEEDGVEGEEQQEEAVMMDVDGEEEDGDEVVNGAVEEEEEDDDDESDGIPSDVEEFPEWITVDLSVLRKDVQCAICLGIIRKTRTVMGCLHRFCRECIDKSMRLGNKECPACRMHCPSRRALRDDPEFDDVISRLFKDIDKYEEEEFSLHEEDKARNEQIQASIAEIIRRQSEALNKKPYRSKDTPGTSAPRSSQRQRNTTRRRNSRGSGIQEDENEQEQTDQAENEQRVPVNRSQPSSTANPEREAQKEIRGNSPGMMLMGPSWGSAAARSNTRHGSGSKSNRAARVSRLVDHLRNCEENEDQHELHLMIICLDKRRKDLIVQQPYLSCSSGLSVDHLCEYVARETPLRVRDVELLLVKEAQTGKRASTFTFDSTSLSHAVGYSKADLLPLEGSQTLSDLKARCTSKRGIIVIGYRPRNSVHPSHQ